MKVTEFRLGSDGEVAVHPTDAPRWQTYAEEAGQPLTGVQLVEQGAVQGAEFQLVRIASGGYFAMHDSDDVAFCQVVSGKGDLGLPGGRSVPYEGPELYIFHPGTLHEWRDVTADTLLSVCLVRA
jgi:quercetin dioxygenase-like cupin family protein